MNTNQLLATQVLQGKEMFDNYAVKASENFELPITQHQVTLYYKTRFLYDILQQQVLRFLATSFSAMEQQELQALVGVDAIVLEQVLETLHRDGVIELENNALTLNDSGRISAEDGYSPLKSTQQYFEFFYERVTDFIVENPLYYYHREVRIHPIIRSESYKIETYAQLQKDSIADFYQKVEGQNLQQETKEFQIEHITHQVISTEYTIVVQQLKLYQRNKSDIVCALWNAQNEKIIHLA